MWDSLSELFEECEFLLNCQPLYWHFSLTLTFNHGTYCNCMCICVDCRSHRCYIHCSDRINQHNLGLIDSSCTDIIERTHKEQWHFPQSMNFIVSDTGKNAACYLCFSTYLCSICDTACCCSDWDHWVQSGGLHVWQIYTISKECRRKKGRQISGRILN